MEQVVTDSNGNTLNDGDAVTLTKDIKVKGSSLNLKRGTKVKSIRLTEMKVKLSVVLVKLQSFCVLNF